jgi:hypothetical protein
MMVDLHDGCGELRRQHNERTRDESGSGGPNPHPNGEKRDQDQSQRNKDIADDNLPRAGEGIAEIERNAAASRRSRPCVVIPCRQECSSRS